MVYPSSPRVTALRRNPSCTRPLAVFAEEHLLAVAEEMVRSARISRSVMALWMPLLNITPVLENLNHRCAFVAGGGGEDFLRCGELDVDGAGEEVAASAGFGG